MAIVSSFMPFIRITLLVIGLWTFPIVEGWTTLYKCMDVSGATVFTDRPQQLTHCVALDPETLDLKTTVPQNTTSKAREHEQPNPNILQQPAFPDPQDDPTPASSEPQQNFESPPHGEVTSTTLPLTQIGNAMLVQVLLNRKQYAHLLVDTGASMTVLSYDLAMELDLLSGTEVTVETANTAGGSVQVTTTHVKEIRAGSAVARNVPVAIHDLPNPIPGVSGLLGMSFLNKFNVTLDAKQKTLHLVPHK